MPVLQSAYRSGHSTESCHLKVMSDILDTANSGEVSLVGLLDLSAAFDIVDHEILLHRLRSSFGIGGVILDWIVSFLTNRTQAVVFRSERSSVCRLNCGVPQGSVLGPLLFIRLHRHCRQHGCESTLLCRWYTVVYQWIRERCDNDSL